jgi:hypothetical protein
MATRFYLHRALSTIPGTLPSTQQSVITTNQTFDAVTVNKSMDTTVSAVAQADITATKTPTANPSRNYMTRFISQPLGQTSIAANTWTNIIAGWASSSTPWYPSDSTAHNMSALMVWRPSSGTKIATIFDNTNSSNTTSQSGATTEKTSLFTYVGSAVATISIGDVLIFEQFVSSNTTSSTTFHYGYDGSTISTTDIATNTNLAAYLETPETLTFTPPAITSTVTGKTNTNKRITKV